MKRRLLLPFLVSAALLAQQAPVTIKSDVKVVEVLATVHDKNGAIVNTLSKDDFEIKEDGRTQAIKYFRQDSDLPLTLGLLVDTSLSMRTAIEKERTASYTFLDRVLREKDQAFLIHFDRDVEQLQEITNSRQKLQKALDELNTPSFHRSDDPSGPESTDPNARPGDPDDQRGGQRGGRRGAGGGTALYDAVFLASDEVLNKQQGRKSVILLSDGQDRGSKVSLERAIEAAQRANVIVYTIYYSGQNNFGGGDHDRGHRGGGFPGGGYPGSGGGWPGGGGHGGGGRRGPGEEPHVDGKKIMERIAKETGGRMFEAKKSDSVQQAYSEIQDELRHQYALGYTPDKWTSGYHKLEVTAKKKNTKIQAREGYYAGE